MTDSLPLRITVDASIAVSALADEPAAARAAYVFAHGAGAGMAHPFMTQIARGLVERDIATLRFQFPYIERGSRRPDPPKLAHAAVRAAATEAHRRWPQLPLFAGGKSFGGRMTSQTQAAAPMPGVVGLIFLGFPLHPAGKPSIERAQHLAAVKVPMLFAQGTRDELADVSLIESTVEALGSSATLYRVADGDHSFRVRAASGRSTETAIEAVLDTIEQWAEGILDR